MNAVLDAPSNLCYTESNVEQGHNFDGDGCRALFGAGGSRRGIMHSLQRAKSKSLSVTVLRQHDLLCHVAKEYSSFVAAARHEWFRIRYKYDMPAHRVCRSVASIIEGSVFSQN
ncbi:MAG TPA: hypothetical protein VFU09_08915 [Candidatus Udaeobacter sp.]|nr:hypothetical protein [Candidatus Udaeobacter sp.]